MTTTPSHDGLNLPDKELFNGFRELLDSCGLETSKHDRAIVLIEACIDQGIDTRARIVGVAKHLGFEHGHIAILLAQNTGRSPDSYRWQRDKDGQYGRFEGASTVAV